MNFDIGEIGATLLIGAFVLLLMDGILWYTTAFDLTGFFRGQLGWEAHRKAGARDNPPWVPFWVFVALSLPAGIIAEDVATRIIEERPQVVASTGNWFVEHALTRDGIVLGMSFRPLESKDALRVNSLLRNFSVARSRDTTQLSACRAGIATEPCIEPLLQELAIAGTIAGVCTPYIQPEPKANWTVDAIQADLGTGRLAATPERLEQLQRCLTQIYYRAKNRTYLEPSYFEELRRIEIRRRMTAGLALFSISAITPMWMLALSVALLEWTLRYTSAPRGARNKQRSDVVLAAAILAALCIDLALLVGLHNLLLFSSQGDTSWPAGNQAIVYLVLAASVCAFALYTAYRKPQRVLRWAREKVNFPSPRISILVASATLFLLYLTAVWAYTHESNEINRRAYGYYLELGRRDAACGGACPPAAPPTATATPR